jgi:uncharacterized damage-inducible protein DinB
MKKSLFVATCALCFTVPQAAASQTVTSSLKGLHDITQSNIMATARLLSDELYAFRPTDDVRSAGQILSHVANAQYMFCSAAAGEDSPATENFEETRTSKAAIIEALEMGFGYCEDVYADMTDDMGGNSVSFFGSPSTGHGVLAFNSAHNYEHYGNLVTYMRINGIVPPSSR